MAISYTEVRVEQVATADTSRYLVPVGTTAEITYARVVNESTATQTISIYTPNPTAAAGDTNLAVKTKAILPGQTDLLPELLGSRYNAGTDIRTTASDGSSLNLFLSIMLRTI
jgi:hypothetical protein